jgi:hypothetical protein
MKPSPAPPPRRRHRAAILIFLMLFGIAWLVLTFPSAALSSGRSLVALAVVVVVAAVGGIAFSWSRYFGRPRGEPGSTRPPPGVSDEG